MLKYNVFRINGALFVIKSIACNKIIKYFLVFATKNIFSNNFYYMQMMQTLNYELQIKSTTHSVVFTTPHLIFKTLYIF